ncbi:MAG: hypothetical protein AAFO91_01805, partial [Bacteroidota bacterium]
MATLESPASTEAHENVGEISFELYDNDVTEAITFLRRRWQKNPDKRFSEGEFTLTLARYFYQEDNEDFVTLPDPNKDPDLHKNLTIALQSPVVLSRVLRLLALKEAKSRQVATPIYEELTKELEGEAGIVSVADLIALVHQKTQSLRGVEVGEDGEVVIKAGKGGDQEITVAEFVKRKTANRLDLNAVARDVDRSAESVGVFSELRGERALSFVRDSIRQVSGEIEQALESSDLEPWQVYYVQKVLLPKIQVPEGEVNVRGVSRYRNVLWVLHSHRLCTVVDQGERSADEVRETYYRPRITLERNPQAADIFLAHARSFFGAEGENGRGNEEYTGELVAALEALGQPALDEIMQPRNVIPATIRGSRPLFDTIKDRQQAEEAEAAADDWESTYGLESVLRGGAFDRLVREMMSPTQFKGERRGLTDALTKIAKLHERLHDEQYDTVRSGVEPYLLTADSSPDPIDVQIATLQHSKRSLDGLATVLETAYVGLQTKISKAEESENTLAVKAYTVILRAYEKMSETERFRQLVDLKQAVEAALAEKKKRRAAARTISTSPADKVEPESKTRRRKRGGKTRFERATGYRTKFEAVTTPTEKAEVLRGQLEKALPYIVKRLEAIRVAVKAGESEPLSGKEGAQ